MRYRTNGRGKGSAVVSDEDGRRWRRQRRPSSALSSMMQRPGPPRFVRLSQLLVQGAQISPCSSVNPISGREKAGMAMDSASPRKERRGCCCDAEPSLPSFDRFGLIWEDVIEILSATWVIFWNFKVAVHLDSGRDPEPIKL